jgi:hypothetical protein
MWRLALASASAKRVVAVKLDASEQTYLPSSLLGERGRVRVAFNLDVALLYLIGDGTNGCCCARGLAVGCN